MRRREKFVIVAVLLSLCLLGIQYVSLDWRYLAIGIFSILTYLFSAFALSEDLQRHEWLTILPFPVLYGTAVALFYFLLPESVISRVSITALFGVGMYALLLTANIYSVAKGRNIQLLYAAQAVGLFFTLLTSLLFSNTIFSLKLPFYGNGLLIGLVHFPVILMSLWSTTLEEKVSRQVWWFSSLLTLVLVEFAVLVSFLPMPVWNLSLFIMAMMYIGLGVMQSFLRGRLFQRTINEYTLVGILVFALFLILFPLK
ncbi:MAG: hypothetical protein ACOZAN_03735 [Patescibacteria group bacterium]